MHKIILLLLITNISYAGCDLTKFRWGCTIFPKVKESRANNALIYCGSSKLYVSNQQFELIRHYQDAGVRLSIMVDDVYYDGPCVAIRHDYNLQKIDKVEYF